VDKYVKDVKSVAAAMQDIRKQHPNYREYLIDDVAEEQFQGKGWLAGFQEALDSLFDGLSAPGLEEGLLAFSSGLGARSVRPDVGHWHQLSLERLKQLLGVSGEDELTVEAHLEGEAGLVCLSPLQVLRIQGTPVILSISTKIEPKRFTEGQYTILVRRRKEIRPPLKVSRADFKAELVFNDADFPPGNAPGKPVALSIQLVKAGRPVKEVRIRVRTCGPSQPNLVVVEPPFEVIPLIDIEPNDDGSESLKVRCDRPAMIHVFQWGSQDDPLVTIDDIPGTVEACKQSPEGADEGWVIHKLTGAIDLDREASGKVEMEISVGESRRTISLEGEDIEPGEFTIEDELRIAIVESKGGDGSRLDRVMQIFNGAPADTALPVLGNIDAPARWRLSMADRFEKDPNGWRPIITNILDAGSAPEVVWDHPLVRSSFPVPTFLAEVTLSEQANAALQAYADARAEIVLLASDYVHTLRGGSDRPIYAAGPTFVDKHKNLITQGLSRYLDAYATTLLVAQDIASHVSDRGETGALFLLLHLDQVDHDDPTGRAKSESLGIGLLGPWHPLVVAKRFMVQSALHSIGSDFSGPKKQLRHLAALLERVDSFRCLAYQYPAELTIDPGFTFPTSDPGWHIIISSRVMQSLSSTGNRGVKEIGRNIRNRTGLRSALFLGSSELWDAGFAPAFVHAYPSRRHLTLRIAAGVDPQPIVMSCLSQVDTDRRNLGTLLPGGVHVLLDRSMEQQEPLPPTKPPLHLYDSSSEVAGAPFPHFHPDIRLSPQREEWQVSTCQNKPTKTLPVPRGSGDEAVFFAPIALLGEDRERVPQTRLLECGERLDDADPSGSDESGGVGRSFLGVLRTMDALIEHVQRDRPVLLQTLGLNAKLDSEWTILPGGDIDPGAIAKYIAAGRGSHGEDRALWDFKMDIDRTVSSYFIVCRVPKTVQRALPGNVLVGGQAQASLIVKELAEVGFAVGETLKSGKAAVGILGVVAALRLLGAAWLSQRSKTERSCTLLLPVDCFPGLLLHDSPHGRKRTDLLALHLRWNTARPYLLSISHCAIECKYVAGVFPDASVDGALKQAENTTAFITTLLDVAKGQGGVHARLALLTIVRFGLRLLAAKNDITPEDEQQVLEALLRGDFECGVPLTENLVFTTGAADLGPGGITLRNTGWWVSLTNATWPKGKPSSGDAIVAQLARIFESLDQSRPASEGPSGPTTTNSIVSRSSRTLSSSDAETHGESPLTREPPARDDSKLRERELGHSITPELPNHDAVSAESIPSKVTRSSDGRGLQNHTLTIAECGPSNGPETDVHPAFNGFVGNPSAITTLTIQIQYAQVTGARAIQALGLFGPKSTGKTELARRIARALDIPALMLSETGLGNIDQLAERMQEKAKESGRPMMIGDKEGGLPVLRCPPMLLFIDEVHQLPARVQDMLLPMLEASDRTLRGSRVIIDASDVSFVIATTDDGKLREAFRSRVRQVHLQPYNVQEVAQMLRSRLDGSALDDVKTRIDPVAKNLGEEALIAIATAARAVPRIAIQLLGEVAMAIRIQHCGTATEDVWGHIQTLVPCDQRGLTPQDKRYLALVEKRGPVGFESIAQELGTDSSNVVGSIEPFLIQMGWVNRTAGGRVLSALGKQLLRDVRSAGG
jgi:DNA phosphorothioation-dependent restriction protein DptH